MAEQVGGHTPTLEGFHWRHDALAQRQWEGSGLALWATFVWNVNLLPISKARGVAGACSPQIVNWCLHNLSTASALFRWHLMTSQNLSSAHPVSYGTVDSVVSVTWTSCWCQLQLHFFFFFCWVIFFPQSQRETLLNLTRLKTLPAAHQC